MGAIHYEAVYPDGEFKRSNTLADLVNEGGYLFLVKKEEGYHCGTYSRYQATVVNESDKPTKADYKGFGLKEFKIDGIAANYYIDLSFYFPNGALGKREFRHDIRYNHPGEGYSRIKPEWSLETQYKDIFAYFDNVAKYGDATYTKILELEREVYAKDAAYRQEENEYACFKDRLKQASMCIHEFMIPDEWRSISEWMFDGFFLTGIQRVFIPASITFIERFPFSFCDRDNVKQIFCSAEEPPKIGRHFQAYSPNTVLYVPKNSLEKYTSDADWSEVFPVIKGF